MTPQRIQLSRKKGWRLPPNTVVVSRPSYFGNPFRVEPNYKEIMANNPWPIPQIAPTQQAAVDAFRHWLPRTRRGRLVMHEAETNLRGKNLACWCMPGTPCHADVLLEIANAPLADYQEFSNEGEAMKINNDLLDEVIGYLIGVLILICIAAMCTGPRLGELIKLMDL